MVMGLLKLHQFQNHNNQNPNLHLANILFYLLIIPNILYILF